MREEEKARVRYLTLPEGRRILAVSDIHGNLTYLKALLDKVRFSRDDILFLVGDMIEKGPESLDTLRFVMELEKNYTVYPISGNCESLWLPWRLLAKTNRERLREYALDRKNSLFNEMLEQVSEPLSEDTDMDEAVALVTEHFKEELDWLDKLPNICVTEHLLFVHSGIDTAVPLEKQHRIRVMDMKAFYSQEASFSDRYCIVGHWPVVLYNEQTQDASPIIDRSRQIICLDGGNVLKRDGQLNALVIPEEASTDFTWEFYEDYPRMRVLDAQEEGVYSENALPHNIIWSDNQIELLQLEEDAALIRQVSSGRKMWAPVEYLYYDGGILRTEDITDAMLKLEPGDEVALVSATSRGNIVKHQGKSGWYNGRLAQIDGAEGKVPGFWREKMGHTKPFRLSIRKDER